MWVASRRRSPLFQDETDQDMLSGAGTPLNDILAAPQKAGSGRAAVVAPQDNVKNVQIATPVSPVAVTDNAQDSVARSRAAGTIDKTGPGGLESVAGSRVTAQSFREMLQEFDKNFTDRDRVPLNLYNTIRKMIEQAVQDGKTGSVDRSA